MMANLVTTWCQMYMSSLPARSDANSPFFPVLSRGQSETHAAVRYLFYSSSFLGLFVVLKVMKIALILFGRWLLKFDYMYFVVSGNQQGNAVLCFL
jgi:hypothetical protein